MKGKQQNFSLLTLSPRLHRILLQDEDEEKIDDDNEKEIEEEKET
jgi:hypothetical protein